jgi:hypothetical protein
MSDMPLSFFVVFILHSCVRGNSETIYYSWRKLLGRSTLNTQSSLADLHFLDLTSQKAHRIRKVLEGTADGYQKKILRLKNKAEYITLVREQHPHKCVASLHKYRSLGPDK